MSVRVIYDLVFKNPSQDGTSPFEGVDFGPREAEFGVMILLSWDRALICGYRNDIIRMLISMMPEIPEHVVRDEVYENSKRILN